MVVTSRKPAMAVSVDDHRMIGEAPHERRALAGDREATAMHTVQMATLAERDDVVVTVVAAVGAEAHGMRRTIAPGAQGIRAAEAVARVDVAVGDVRELVRMRVDERLAGEAKERHSERAMALEEAFEAAIGGSGFWLDAERD
jgi:hypothetical protein